MPQLNQIIALEKGVKNRAKTDLTQAHHQLARTAQLSGVSRNYQPKNEEGDRFPPESTKVQINAQNVIKEVSASLAKLFDITLTKDSANGSATADIVVNNKTLARAVPVTYLLFLEKELTDIQTFVTKLPVLDPAETWTYDSTSDAFATVPQQTVKTKKVPRNHVKWEPPDATFVQQAQVEVFTEDVLVGYWTTIKFSGALQQADVNAMKARIIALIEAVKTAREAANSLPVTDKKIGADLLNYVFNG